MRTSRSRNRIDVLIVDDDPDLRHDLRVLLEGEGYSCAEAEDGAEALNVIEQCTPRLALLDLMMPKADGLTVARHLRAKRQTRGVHIQILTGRGDASARRAAEAAGCEAFLTKPFDVDDLLATVSLAVHAG
jgi:two-component system response regulator MprA